MSDEPYEKATNPLSHVTDKLDRERREERHEKMRCAAIELAIMARRDAAQPSRVLIADAVLDTAEAFFDFIVNGKGDPA